MAPADLGASFRKLLELCHREEDEIPKGWHRACEIAERMNKPEHAVDLMLRRLWKNGKVQSKIFNVKISDNRILPCRHFYA